MIPSKVLNVQKTSKGKETGIQIRNIFILKNKWNNEHFHFSSHICLIDKRNHEKAVLQNMSN